MAASSGTSGSAAVYEQASDASAASAFADLAAAERALAQTFELLGKGRSVSRSGPPASASPQSVSHAEF